MDIVLYISKREYGGTSIEQGYNRHSYSVGYHGVVGTIDTTKPTSGTKLGTVGYGTGDMLVPHTWMEGCIQSDDGDEAILSLILSLYDSYSLDTVIVVISDQHLVRVTSEWMPNWKTTAVKGNGHPIHQSDLWLKVRDKGVHFITHLVSDIGDDLADAYSVSLDAFQYTCPASQFVAKPTSLSPLLWTGLRVHSQADHDPNYHCLVNTKELTEIGNMDPLTIYGLVYLKAAVPIIDELVAYTDAHKENVSTSVIRLKNLTMASTGTAVARHRCAALSKPHRYTDSYSLGLDVPIIEEITMAHKLYKARSIYSIMKRLMDKILSIEGSLCMSSNEVKIIDITDYLIKDKKPLPELLLGPLSLKLPLASGRSTMVATDTELPPLNTIRAIAKGGGRIYSGYLNLDGLYRYFYCLTHPDGVGLYSPWITKLEYA